MLLTMNLLAVVTQPSIYHYNSGAKGTRPTTPSLQRQGPGPQLDLTVLAWRNQGLCEREEAQGRVGQLEMCEGIFGLDNRHRSWDSSPFRAKISRTESTPCHPGHATTHRPEVAGALGGKALLHAPCGARGGSTSLP